MSTYEAWRATHQSSEAAARAAYDTVEKLHAQNVDLKAEIEALQSRVQELGEMARENRSKKVIGLEGRIAELEAQLSAIGAGGVEPLRKTSADTSALRAALEEAEAALEVATSRLFARGANYPVYVTSEACALEIVRKALGKSQADHFRGVTKMMPPERACTRSHPHEKQSAVCDLQEVTDWLRHFAAGGLSISAEKELALRARVQELEAKAKVRLSIPPVQLPEPDINTANHAGVRVLGYTAHKVSELLAASAAHRARADDEKAKLQHYRTALEAREALAKRLIADVQVAATIATAACQRVAELPDRASPADWPEAMLVTGDELHMIVREAVIEAQTAPAHPAEGVPAQTTRDAVIQHLTNAGVLEHDGCGIFIASGDASELIDACMALSTHAHHEKGAAAQAVALLATGGQAQAVERIAIDMKQTAELLDLFGGEPTEFTVMQCNGQSGPGLYAYVTEYPEDGASYLGKTDCEAQPAPQALPDAQDTNRWMGIGKAIERACADLPEETEIIVSLEKDAGTVTLIDKDGNEHENFSCDYGFAGVMNEAINTAIADQTKQGGAHP